MEVKITHKNGWMGHNPGTVIKTNDQKAFDLVSRGIGEMIIDKKSADEKMIQAKAELQKRENDIKARERTLKKREKELEKREKALENPRKDKQMKSSRTK